MKHRLDVLTSGPSRALEAFVWLLLRAFYIGVRVPEADREGLTPLQDLVYSLYYTSRVVERRITTAIAVLPWVVFAVERKQGLLTDLGPWAYVAAGGFFVMNSFRLVNRALAAALRTRSGFMKGAQFRWTLWPFIGPIVGIVGCYSAVYLRAAIHSSGCFGNATLTHLDAAYIAVGNLSTIGSGGLTPGTQPCRGLVLTQSLVDLVIITVVAAALATRLFTEPHSVEPSRSQHPEQPGGTAA